MKQIVEIEWTPVAGDPPELTRKVLLTIRTEMPFGDIPFGVHVESGALMKDGTWWRGRSWLSPLESVTHWAEMPEPARTTKESE